MSNGATVGRNASNGGAFAGLFRPGATGLVNDRGNFEFFRANGDLVLSYRWSDTAGNTDNETIVARNAGGSLKLIGNQYKYTARVAPILADRDFLNTPDYSYFSTGYNVNIANRVDGNGQPVFSKVIATTPFGTTVNFVPSAGNSYLVATQADGVTPTASPVLRLAAGYKKATTAGNPAEKEPQLYYVSPQYTEEQLRAVPDQSVWKLEFVHADGVTPNTVQSYRTLSRAATIAETRQVIFADLTPELRAEIVSGSAATGYIEFGAPSANEPNVVDFSADGGKDGWTVPQGALAPTGFIAYGRAPNNGARFNDSLTIRNTLRKAVLSCSPQGAGDTHCDSSTGVLQYAQGTRLNTFELWARSNRQMEVSKMLAIYKIQ
jgi:hypothetical protein